MIINSLNKLTMFGAPTWPRDKIKAYQRQKLQSLITLAYQGVPYYRELFKERGLLPEDFKSTADLSKLPIITKHLINSRYDDFLNSHYPKHKMHFSLSSGSTGEPFTTHFNKQTWLRKKLLSKLRARSACGMRLGERIAMFETASLEVLAKRRSSHVLGLPYHMRYFSAFEEPEKQLAEVLAFDAQNYYAQASFLYKLSGAIREAGQRPKQLRRIFTASEYLSDSLKSYLEDFYQAPVYDHYGCTETKEVAWQCPDSSAYHINEDEVIVEVVDSHGQPSQDGVGEILLTDLHNKAMPLFRYHVGDTGILMRDQCSCGRTFALMRPTAGRVTDSVQLPSGKELSPYQFTTIIETFKGINKYQFVQPQTNKLLVSINKNNLYATHSDNELLSQLHALTHQELTIEIQHTQNFHTEENGKFKVFIAFKGHPITS